MDLNPIGLMSLWEAKIRTQTHSGRRLCENTEGRQPTTSLRRNSTADTLISESWGNKYMLFAPQSEVLCYGTTSKPSKLAKWNLSLDNPHQVIIYNYWKCGHFKNNNKLHFLDFPHTTFTCHAVARTSWGRRVQGPTQTPLANPRSHFKQILNTPSASWVSPPQNCVQVPRRCQTHLRVNVPEVTFHSWLSCQRGQELVV